ncbi:MAG: HAMP domain-containing histidine kinase [Ferruginibacter sp.]|nr:HAMP domain-containing histidine kinase [Chitinophagaceae bacterium]
MPAKPAGLITAHGNLLKKFSALFSNIKLLLPGIELKRRLQPLLSFFVKAGARVASATSVSLHHISVLVEKNRSSGVTITMDDYEKRKLGIFNQLNLFQFLTGIIVPLAVFINGQDLPASSALVIISPALVSILVLYLNSRHKHTTAMLCYFILYPFLTSLVYVNGMNLGIELFFVLYGILSVFFLQELGSMLFCLTFSMLNYFMLGVVLKKYQFYLETSSPALYLFNHILAIMYIFYGLYLIKRENTGYQSGILWKNNELIRVNQEVQKQKEELNELNSFKNRLFSIISHDLKTPMYALRNLFQHINHHKVSAREIKEFIPEVVKDLNYTTSLMENLLQWAKSQMQADALRPQQLEVAPLINDTIQLLRLQADAKKINLESRVDDAIQIYADKDMVSLVLRNLISNAIKFTPENGCVVVGAHDIDSFIEVYVRDTGTGMKEEDLQNINANNYFTTTGTANESGTGLGLMLCKEFLARNGGRLSVESEWGKGSIFSFTLPSGH